MHNVIKSTILILLSMAILGCSSTSDEEVVDSNNTTVNKETNSSETKDDNKTLNNPNLLDIAKLVEEIPTDVNLNFLTLKSTDNENEKPNAVAGNDQVVNENENVQFDSSSSYDDDGYIENYQWKMSNTVLSNSSSFSKNDFTQGTYLITLIVTDDDGDTDTDTLKITVNQGSAK